MTIESNAVPGSPRESQVDEARVFAPPAISATRRFYWSVRRELWENRSIYIAPLAVAALFLFGFCISLIRFPAKMRAASALDPMQQRHAIEQPYNFIALLIMGTAFVVAVFYCLEALHAERRDRSILFWKSLPVSDLTTVLAKASIPIVVIQALTFALIVVVQFIMLLLSSAALQASGQSAGMLWSNLSMPQMWLMLLYHLLAIHALWYAPFYAWLLLVSAWARRATFLWAFLPLFAISVAEKIAFSTSHFGAFLGWHMSGRAAGVSLTAGSMAMEPISSTAPIGFLINPGLWLGLAVAAAFLAAAARLRRYRGPI